MFNWFNMNKKSLPQQVLENTKDIENLNDQELSDITQLNYKQDAKDSLTYADGKATFKGKMSIIRNENTQNLIVNSEVEVNISSGDDDIIIYAGEDNVSLKIRLDNETRNNILRALKTPILAPTEDEFVVVDTNNAQKMIESSKIEKTENKIQNMSQTYNTDAITKYPCLDVLNNTYRGLDTFVSREFESQESALDWIKNNAPAGVYNKVFQISGQIKAYIIQKVSSAYGCVLIFSYNSENIILKRLFAGEWQPDRVI